MFPTLAYFIKNVSKHWKKCILIIFLNVLFIRGDLDYYEVYFGVNYDE